VNWVVYAIVAAAFLVVFSGLLATEAESFQGSTTVNGATSLIAAAIWPLVGAVLLLVGLCWLVGELGKLSISVWDRVS
jgi:hypothetical protein